MAFRRRLGWEMIARIPDGNMEFKGASLNTSRVIVT